jgi:uncharacterized protein (DUF1800 family)
VTELQIQKQTPRWRFAFGAPAALALLLAAHGSSNAANGALGATGQALAARSTSSTGVAKAPIDRPATPAEAARFMTQASFGPSDGDNELLYKLGYSGWIDYQFSLPSSSHKAYWEAANAAIQAADATQSAGQAQVLESFWKQALNGNDPLRQRVAFALSQIFVISTLDGTVNNEPRATAAWLDLLGAKSFGNYRDLLEAVALNPLMGRYLTHLGNQKADLNTGRIPDQNFARESMQLFSIGVFKLNPDGTPVRVNGNTVPTYTSDDVAGLSRVFTGFSWACPAAPNSNNCFFNGSSGGVSDPDRYIKPMVAYPQFHSTEAKTFLGTTIPVQTTPNPLASLKTALDALAAHPNVGPFLSRQLIQRLVGSNPSSAYVTDVAAVFANNGAGVRGDLKAVIKALLLHPEARSAVNPNVANNSAIKLREPVLRLSAYLRAFPHTSDTGNWKVGNTDSVSTSLGQTPLRAPSVFNFYRPGYVAPGTQSAAAGLVAPEMQLVNETSVSGWVNAMRDNLSNGVGINNGTIGTTVYNRRDLQRNWAAEMEMASKPPALVSFVTDRLLYGQATDALRTEILNAVTSIVVPALNGTGSNLAQVNAAKRNRINVAVLLTLAAPEFLVQK